MRATDRRRKALTHSVYTITPDNLRRIMSRKKFFQSQDRNVLGENFSTRLFGVCRPHVGTYTVYIGHIDWPILVYVQSLDRWYVNDGSSTAANILKVAGGSFSKDVGRGEDKETLIRMAEYGEGYKVILKMQDAANVSQALDLGLHLC